MNKLSKAQQMFLATASVCGGVNRSPMCGQRDSGRDASAWHRTAQSLVNRGLVSVVRHGNSTYSAHLTENGRKLGSATADAWKAVNELALDVQKGLS